MEVTPNEEFNLLAALQALDILDELESRALQKKLQESPELESELTAVETTIAAIAYTTPLVAVAPDLKNRLTPHAVRSAVRRNPHAARSAVRRTPILLRTQGRGVR